jgi:phosphotransferase family enzyme
MSDQVEVVVAHHDCATLRVGEVFLKIDADQTRTDVEVEAMAMAPIPTPQVLWRKPPVLALAALPGMALGRLDERTTDLDHECTWLLANDILPAELVTRNREIAEAALRPWTPVFVHGDLQVAHVFVDGDQITGVVDWSEAGRGDAMFDLAILTLGHPEHLADVVAGYGGDLDLDVIRGWWSLRSLTAIRWLIEHGFDPFEPGCEVDVLRSHL